MTTLRDLIGQKLDVEDFDDMPEEVLRDTLEGIEGSLGEKIDAIAGLLTSWSQHEDVIAAEIKRLQSRKTTFANRKTRLKDYLAFQLGRLNQPKLETDLHTVSLRKGQQRVVIDADSVFELGDNLLVYKDPTPNKKAIKLALDDGQDIPAHLERGDPYVVVS